MARAQRGNFDQPETTRSFPHGTLKLVSLGEVTVGNLALEPGWRWLSCVQPIAGTRSCQSHHVGFALRGHMHVVMDDGSAIDVGPGDAYDIPAGHDAWVVGDETYRAIEFSGTRTYGVTPSDLGGGVVGTLLFTDIVGSTARLASIGDARWSASLLDHNALMRAQLDAHRGQELATTGDGFLAMFDSASRAVRCGHAMARVSETAGLPIRVGCHTGEVDIVCGEARGVAVHVAARVLALAGSGQVFVSWTTCDLLAGSAVAVESVGAHELKGITGPREVFRALASG